MKQRLFPLLFLLALLTGCPSTPPELDAGELRLPDATQVEAGHRVGSFSPTPSGTGLRKVVAGVESSAAATLVDADVSASAAIGVSKLAPAGTNGFVLKTTAGVAGWAAAGGGASAGATAGQVQTGDGIGGFTAPANVLAGTSFVSIGATPAASGGVRLANATGVCTRNVGNTADVCSTFVDGSDWLYLGSDGVFAKQAAYAYLDAVNQLRFAINGAAIAYVTSTSLLSTVPIYGTSSPYGVHGKTTVTTTGTFTLASADYALEAIMLTGGTAGTVTFPTPSDDAHAYTKTIINTSGVTKTLTDGGATTQTFNTGFSARFLFDLAGVHLTGGSTAYP
jgi:hypothetical protein